uniref:Uncharacterized protein n=1 Tax=Arundo donax TaxID=35708 RepID=A0A0A8YG30_ARUDO
MSTADRLDLLVLYRGCPTLTRIIISSPRLPMDIIHQVTR